MTRIARHVFKGGLYDDCGICSLPQDAAIARHIKSTDAPVCNHPNGFGSNGCAGCGGSGSDVADDATPPFKHNGVTTEIFNCEDTAQHAAHLWRPGKNTEWFTCHGAGEAPPASSETTGVPEGLVMVERPSGPPFVVPAGAPATHTGRPSQHSGQHAVTNYFEQAENLSALIGTFAAIEDAPPIKEGMDFHDWWVAMADREAPTIQRKAEEYGTNSLVEMGRLYARAQGREITDLEAIEIGCFLYAYGKIQRVADALLKGKSPNVDSWHDLTIYSLMVQFSREKGTWP